MSAPTDNQAASLRRSVYLILAAAATGIMLGRILAECERRMAHSSKPEWPMAETLAHVTETLGDLLEGWDDHGA